MYGGSTLLGIFGSGLAIVLFNFFPQLIINIGYHADGTWWIGFIANEADSVWSGTILSDAFFHYLPALTILWVLSLFLDVALLSRGRWETWTRWSALVLKVMTIALVGIMLPGPALVSANAEALIAACFPDPLATRLAVNFVEQGTIVVLVITVIASIITVLRLLTRLTGRNLSPALEKFAHP